MIIFYSHNIRQKIKHSVYLSSSQQQKIIRTQPAAASPTKSGDSVAESQPTPEE